MPRIDNGTGRDISKWNGTLEKALIARKDMLNKCKTNNDLIDILMDCEKDGLSMNGTDYTDRLIATISSNPNFHKNFQNVYNVILKGTGNGVLRCSAKKTSKKISESDEKRTIARAPKCKLREAEKALKKTIKDWIESEMTNEIKADAYEFFRCSDKYYLDDLVTYKQFENIMFKNGFDDQGWMWKSLISESKSLKESVNVYDFLDADSDLVHTKHINDYIFKDNAIEIPDAPSKIEIAGHTIDYEEDEGDVVFDGVEAKCDDREELMGGETGVYYADTDNGTYTILFYYQRHGLLADVAVLEPELTKEVQYNLVE